MNWLKTTFALALVLTLPGLVHALTLRTAPFPGPVIFSGVVRCAVTNASEKQSDRAVITLIGAGGDVLETDGPYTLGAGETGLGSPRDLANSSPAWCRCAVPNRQHTCSLTYVNGAVVEIIKAE